jgi:hypothetical protein
MLYTDLLTLREFQNLLIAPASKAMIETLFIAKFFPLKISQKDVFVDHHNNVIKNK